MSINIRIVLLLFSVGLFFGCRPTEELMVVEENLETEEIIEEAVTVALLSPSDFSRLRPTLTDFSNVPKNEIDPVFELTPDDLQALSSNNGYRIQLISTVNIAEADSVRLRYYDWAVNQQFSYSRLPEAYVVFRQPNYRVRVGDFRSRARAIEFLEKVRPHFTGAWVIMDTIDPDLVE